MIYLSCFPEYCGLPPAVPGLCMAIYHVFTYYPEKNSCELFVYSGCNDNENRFKTLEECEELCVEDKQIVDFK